LQYSRRGVYLATIREFLARRDPERRWLGAALAMAISSFPLAVQWRDVLALDLSGPTDSTAARKSLRSNQMTAAGICRGRGQRPAPNELGGAW
jgi:hypothetical protein